MRAVLSLILVTVCGASVTANEDYTSIYDAWASYIVGGLVTDGVERAEAERTFRKIETLAPKATGPGSWVHELALAGDVHRRAAETHDVAGRQDEALVEYRRAMAYFNAARFPATYTDARKAAYNKQLNAYRKVASLSDFPIELVEIPFEGRLIKAHFHSRSAERNPVLIWSGGLDGWKTGGMDFKKRLMREGFSVLAVDLPGTGESEWPLEPNSDRIYSRVIDYLKTRPDVDAKKIAAYFGSFSGVYAIKLALTDPDIAAAVNHSGGIHLFFHPPMDQLPPLTTTMGMRATATTYAMDYFERSLDDIKSHFSNFSLMRQGLLKPTPEQKPLLNIYGTADRLMPIQDLDVLMESGIQATNLVYDGAHHMAWEHAEDHQTKMIDWLKEQMKM